MGEHFDFCLLGYGTISSELVIKLSSNESKILVVTDRAPFIENEKYGKVTFISRDDFLKKVNHLSLIYVVCNLRLDNLSEELFINLVKATLSRNPIKFLQMSSGSIYGETEFPAKESSQPSPISEYARLRMRAEEVVSNAISNQIELITLRISNVYGHKSFDDYINSTMSKIMGSEELLVYNDGVLQRDYIHIEDLINAVILILKSKNSLPQILNISTGVPLRVSDVLRIFRVIKPDKVLAIRTQEKPLGVITKSVLNSDLARNSLNWNPRNPEEGLSNYFWDFLSSNSR